YFFKNGSHLTDIIKNINNADVLSIDSSIGLSEYNRRFEGKFILQGNLSPEVLFESEDVIRKKIDEIFSEAEGLKGHIFNLGHGVLPGTPVDSIKFAVDYIHEAGRK
ncbi:unnamed protein product, partial [marine sediment metagenome]